MPGERKDRNAGMIRDSLEAAGFGAELAAMDARRAALKHEHDMVDAALKRARKAIRRGR